MSAFTIVVPQIPGYPHTEAFRECAESVMWGLRALGHTAELGTQPWPSTRAILFGVHCLSRKEAQALPPDSIVYNLEPVASDLFPVAVARALQARTVWDYSPEGVERWTEEGKRAELVPLGFAPEMQRLTLREPTVDVLFYGSLNARRQRILEDLGRRVRLKVLFACYGAERDAWIEESHLVLNLHYYEGAPLEEPRIAYLLANRIAVVSEGPVGNHGIIASRYDNLVSTCCELLERPQVLRLWADKGHRVFARSLESEILARALG
jgi:hypothetical protein